MLTILRSRTGAASRRPGRSFGASIILLLAPALALSGFAVVSAPLEHGGVAAHAAEPVVEGSVPLITGDVRVGNTVSYAYGAWGPAPVDLRHEWYVDAELVQKGGDLTIPAEFFGKALSLYVIGEKTDYKTTRLFSAGRIVDGGMLTAPKFAAKGVPKVGQQIEVERSGDWAPSEGVNQNYEWYYGGEMLTPKAAFDAPTHVIRPEAAGKVLSVKVIGSKLGYHWKEIDLGVAVVLPAADVPFVSAPTPSIVKVQQPSGPYLSAQEGVWDPVPGLSYQWFRDGVKLTGPQFDFYRLTPADAGKSFKVQVTGKLTGRITTVRTSAAFVVPGGTPVVRRLSATPKPRISGTVRVGKKISVRAGSWKPARVSLSYRWLRNGKAIKGATKAKYKLTRKDRGKRISVRVTGKKSGYVTVVKTSSSKRVR